MIDRSRLGSLLAVVGLATTAAVLLVPSTSAAAGQSSRKVVSGVAQRSYLDADGTSHVVDTRHVTMTVARTTNLRGREEIAVSWTGAHPTGATVADVNSGDGANEEYPFVLLECRGLDSTSVPVAQRIRPQSCWTQSWGERFQKDNTNGFPAWRLDRYATAADRQALVDAPDPRPALCYRPGLAERWVPFDAANGTVYPGGAVGCAGMAPESSNVDGAGLPSNTTYGITTANGTGSADFDVWTSDENASLGCSSTVACALVAVPIMGVSCDSYGTLVDAADRPPARYQAAADTACRATGAYQPGQVAQSGNPSDLAVSGALWWTASNWRNRLTVPLSFATPASICSVVSDKAPINVYGSVLMTEATAQWEPAFCTSASLYPFVHVQTADSAARVLISTGGIDAAFTSRPPDGGFTRPLVQAPIAMSGFAIAYSIDDAEGRHYGALRLDARLLAKLLTESYPANTLVRSNYPALAKNPMNITDDPEFIALNPGLPQYTIREAAATIITLSTESDLIWALTSYIDSDAEARAWLNGDPDPWGMVVNPSYQGIALPVESWPLLDDFELPPSYISSGSNPCYTYSPSPYLSLIANPTSQMSTITQDVQFAISNADIQCDGTVDDVSSLRMKVQGRQQPGFRFVLGVTSISAISRYGLDAARLQTTSLAPSKEQFSTAAGRSFAAPDSAGMRAAAKLLQADESAGTWTVPYAKLAGPAGRAAYPGTMPIYADVPTSGLSETTARHLATLLRYAATTGQQSGTANGDLPPGYLPITDGNGLGALRSYTLRAADAVQAQDGAVPGLDAPAPATTGTSTGAVTTGSSSTAGGAGPTPAPMTSNAPGPGAVVVPPAAAPGATAAAAPTGSSAASPSGAASTPAASPVAGSAGSAAPVALGVTAGQTSGLGRLALPLLLVLGLLTGLAGAALRYPAAAGAAVRAARTVPSRARVMYGRRR